MTKMIFGVFNQNVLYVLSKSSKQEAENWSKEIARLDNVEISVWCRLLNLFDDRERGEAEFEIVQKGVNN